MGYLFLLIALLVGATKGFCGKKVSGYAAEYADATLSNFLRMLICVAVGAVIALAQGGIQSLAVDGGFILVSLLSGVTTSLFVVSWMMAARSGAYMMVDVFLTVGVIIPMVMMRILFSEAIGHRQDAKALQVYLTEAMTIAPSKKSMLRSTHNTSPGRIPASIMESPATRT